MPDIWLDELDDTDEYEELNTIPIGYCGMRCQDCGFYQIKRRPTQYKAYKCPRCKSESFMPEGY